MKHEEFFPSRWFLITATIGIAVETRNRIILLGTVWGGLSYFLFKAVKYEKLKGSDGEV